MIKSESNNQKKFCAISYDSQTFNDLRFYLEKYHEIALHRVDPDEFENFIDKENYDFINLLTNQKSRKKISEIMDSYSVSRFSFLADSADIADINNIGLGSFVYPFVAVYPNAIVKKDVIIHSLSVVAHNSTIGIGCFLSGKVILTGSSNIGDFSWVGTGVTILEKISLPNFSWIEAERVIRSKKEFYKETVKQL